MGFFLCSRAERLPMLAGERYGCTALVVVVTAVLETYSRPTKVKQEFSLISRRNDYVFPTERSLVLVGQFWTLAGQTGRITKL